MDIQLDLFTLERKQQRDLEMLDGFCLISDCNGCIHQDKLNPRICNHECLCGGKLYFEKELN